MGRGRSRSLPSRGWWVVANSPLVIVLLSGGVLAGSAKIYTDHQEATKDRNARRSTLSSLLVEYRQRLSALESLDGELNEFLGEGPKMRGPYGRPMTDAKRKIFELRSKEIGKREWDVIRGSGAYVATAPAYANINLQTIAAQIDDVAEIPTVQSAPIQMLGFLNADPDILWIFVRAYLPEMRTFYVGRLWLTMNGQLPLGRGETPTAQQERVLGFPDVQPGDIERLQKENDALHAEVQAKLTNATEP